MFKKVLIANRGEIAVRIARTVQQMGLRAVAIYSEPDRGAPHVLTADEAYPLEGKTSAETYLRADRIIDIATRHGVDAIHPGYGFLSENAAFAQSCAQVGVTFIGPSPDVIRAMGDKLTAKKLFADAGVPVVPGWSGDASTTEADQITAEADRIGYPVLIKAAAGGGGKGMRVVASASELHNAIEAAKREAHSAFGDARVFIEKFIDRPRHIEVQIFGDTHGNIVHLFERECSIQRRHQKIIEESPSPVMTPELRRRIGEAAVTAARTIGYTNAGTVEFMLDPGGSFHFLEVNTRLQVEHPVTEMITGHDLVRAQLLVAAGEPLPFTQEELTSTGHAIECRIYAEDAAHGFVPSIGRLEHFVPPQGPNIRVDSGVQAGSEISVYYDPMLAKMIVWGRDRSEALERTLWALDRFVALGVVTNIEFLRNVVDHVDFRAGRLHTKFLDEHAIAPTIERPPPESAYIAAALAAATNTSSRPEVSHDGTTSPRLGPWSAAGPWRRTMT
jgi:3-methylcrotonyl-CoA carboxylase alpha subunit